MLLFNKWSSEGIVVNDLGLKRYINLKPVLLPKQHGRVQSHGFRRLPELKQVRIEDNGGEVTIELVYDEEYRKQVAVDFTPLH